MGRKEGREGIERKGGGKERKKFDEVGGMGKKGKGGRSGPPPSYPLNPSQPSFLFPPCCQPRRGANICFDFAKKRGGLGERLYEG